MNWQGNRFPGSAWLLALFCMTGTLFAETPLLSHQSIPALEKEIESTQEKLDQLPLRLIRESGGTMGIRLFQESDTPHKAWVEVNLMENRQFDTIVVVPAVVFAEDQTPSNHGFPLHFQIRTYDSPGDETGELLFDTSTHPLNPAPKSSPVIIDCPGASAQRIRFIPKQLFLSQGGKQYHYSLSEMLVFDGNTNLALGKPVVSSRWTIYRQVWHRSYLTDGYMPFLEPSTGDSYITNGSRMIVAEDGTSPASITLDLGREIPLDEIRLYPLQMDRNFAVFHRTALGFPKRFRIEVSSDATFASVTTVYDTGATDYPSPGHRLACFSAKGTSGRYVRITASSLPPHPVKSRSILAFSEIEVLSKDEAVSRGAEVLFSHPLDIDRLPPQMLVDGIASTGTILPLRSWLADMSKRNRLEARLAALDSALQERYLQQSRMNLALKWGTGITLLLALAIYFWQRQLRLRHTYRLREDLAADLHDEIGSNFSGIALLSDELSHESDMPADHIPQLAGISDIARSSATNLRALVRFLESRNVKGNLLNDMQTTAELLLAKQAHTLDVDGYRHIANLEPKDKWHLLLFYKEALNNIVKHAEATEVEIRLHLTPHELSLTILDNGRGLDAAHGRPPAHLAMRAQKLKAKLTATTRPEGGTAIHLEKTI